MRWVLGLVFAVAFAAPAGAETLEVRSGDVVAEVSSEPFRISVREARDGDVLLRSSTFGIRTLLGVRKSTSAKLGRQGGAVVAQVSTEDPLGRGFTVRVEPGGAGILAVRATLTGARADAEALVAAFRRDHGERLLGLGERPTGVDHWGQEIETYVSDGPYQPGGERTGLSLFIPPPGFRDRDDATYFPIPWVLSTRGHGVLLDNADTAYHRFGTEAQDEWSVEATQTGELRLRVFGGGTPARALKRFTAAVGRQPRADAPWIFGPWYQPGGSQEEQLEQLRTLREAGAPVSVAQTYLHYLPCGDHVDRRESERARVAALHDLGVAVTTYFNPMLCATYQPVFDEAAASGALIRRADGSPYTYRYSSSPTNHFMVGQFDFTSQAGRELFTRLLGDAIADGHDGWMEDFGEYTPLDAHAADGSTGAPLHNRYVTDYHCAAHAAVQGRSRPIVRFQRSGFTGSARCAQVVWSGDPTTGWGYDGLASQVKAALSAGVSGISTWGSDIGGFFAIGEQSLTPELLKRWVQFGAVSPVMRTQRNGVAIPAKDRPQVEDPDQIDNWTRWAHFHNQLYPYLVAADRAYARRGIPIMRHLALAYPRDPRAGESEDSFLFGPDLLAAPVVNPGQTERPVYLPRGRWVDMWRSVGYEPTGGGLLLGRAEVLRGSREVTLPAPIDELPLLARAGALLALIPPSVETLADYDGPGVTGLDQRPGLWLLAFPRGRSRATFLDGERLRSRERRGRWELRIRGARKRKYSVQASLATLKRPLEPCSVRAGGRRVRWGYDRSTKVLRLAVRARRAKVTVRGC